MAPEKLRDAYAVLQGNSANDMRPGAGRHQRRRLAVMRKSVNIERLRAALEEYGNIGIRLGTGKYVSLHGENARFREGLLDEMYARAYTGEATIVSVWSVYRDE